METGVSKRQIFVSLINITVVLGALYLLFRYFGITEVQETIDRAGVWAPLVLVLAKASTLIIAPLGGAPIYPLAGALFGFWKGAGLSIFATGLASLAAFLIGRYLARGWVEKVVRRNQGFVELARAVGQKGWNIVLLARLSPIFPFSVGNYAFGTTSIRAWQYFCASMLGTIPSGAVYTYLGVLSGDLALLRDPDRSRTWGEWLLLAGGFIATVVLFFYLRRLARKALETRDEV